jgi:hypothetical protein
MRKELFLILSVAVISLFITFYALKVTPPITSFQSLPSGWTTLSLTRADFVNNYAPGGLKPPVWILTVAQGGLAQKAYGVISKDQIGQLSGTKPQYDLSIEMDWDKLSWEYPIVVDYYSTPVYTYQLVTWDDWRLVCYESDAKNRCGDNYFAMGKFAWSVTCFCVKQVRETSYMGYLDNCNVHSISTIKLSAAGKTYSSQINTKEQVSQKIGDYAYVVWNGNLLKQNCPSQSPYKPFYKGGWNLGDPNYYDSYKNAYENWIAYIQEIERTQYVDRGVFESKLDNVNTAAQRFISTTKQFGDIVNQGDVSKAYVELSVSSDVQVPVYTFYVSADWLGIYQPQPAPKIVEVKGTSFKSGEKGLIYVKFTNIGDDGNFNVWATCSSPFYPLETTKTIFLKSGSTGEVYIQIGANVNTHTCDYCTIKVQGAGTSNIQTATVQVCADPQQVCNPGARECTIDLTGIKECNPAGSDWVIVQTCRSDEYCSYINGEPKCIQKQPGPGSQPPPQPPQPQPQVPHVLAVVAGLLAFLASGKESIRKKDWVGMAIAGVIGFIVGWIVNWMLENWWIIVIGSILGIVGAGVLTAIIGPATVLTIIITLIYIFKLIRS